MASDPDSIPQNTGQATDDEEVASSGKVVQQKRSAGFPRISLAEAARILKDAGKFGFEHSTSAFAEYMGLSTANSGAFRQKIAALRDFKLLAGRGGTLTMTAVARQIAQPISEEAEQEALQEAFSNCEIFADLYEKSSRQVALQRRHLAATAIHEFRVSPPNGDKFVDSFTESLIAAGLGEEGSDGTVTLWQRGTRHTENDLEPHLEKEHVVDSDFSGSEVPGRQSASIPDPNEGPHSSSSDWPRPVIDHTWEIQGGLVVFQVRMQRAPASAAYSSIAAVIASIEELVKTLGPDQAVEPVDDPEDGTDGQEE